MSPCGGVSIVSTADRFTNAFHVAFSLDASGSKVCGPYDIGGFEDSAMIELRRDSGPCGGEEPLGQPLLFLAVADRDGAGPIDLVPGSDMDTPTVGTVPAGRFRLALRYAPVPCSRRVFDRACIVCSEPFVLENAVSYGIESSGRDLGPPF